MVGFLSGTGGLSFWNGGLPFWNPRALALVLMDEDVSVKQTHFPRLQSHPIETTKFMYVLEDPWEWYLYNFS